MKIGMTYDLRSEYLKMGYSEEETSEFDRESTIDGLEQALRDNGFETDRIGHARQLVTRLAAGDRWDLVFNICEGLRGAAREAQVPAILEAYDIPYVFSDALVLCIALHKGITKSILKSAGIPTADFLTVETEADLGSLDFDGPWFVKPVAEGTGKGISQKSIVHERARLRQVCGELISTYRQGVLVEPYLTGREFTTGIVGTGDDARTVGTMEIVLLEKAEQGVYSYLNKANYEDLVEYPTVYADRDPVVRATEKVALDAWKALGCRDGGRIDLKCDSKGNPMFLEVNPLAGLHPVHSDLPMVARKNGITYTELIGMIMSSALKRLSLKK